MKSFENSGEFTVLEKRNVHSFKPSFGLTIKMSNSVLIFEMIRLFPEVLHIEAVQRPLSMKFETKTNKHSKQIPDCTIRFLSLAASIFNSYDPLLIVLLKRPTRFRATL